MAAIMFGGACIGVCLSSVSVLSVDFIAVHKGW